MAEEGTSADRIRYLTISRRIYAPARDAHLHSIDFPSPGRLSALAVYLAVHAERARKIKRFVVLLHERPPLDIVEAAAISMGDLIPDIENCLEERRRIDGEATRRLRTDQAKAMLVIFRFLRNVCLLDVDFCRPRWSRDTMGDPQEWTNAFLYLPTLRTLRLRFDGCDAHAFEPAFDIETLLSAFDRAGTRLTTLSFITGYFASSVQLHFGACRHLTALEIDWGELATMVALFSQLPNLTDLAMTVCSHRVQDQDIVYGLSAVLPQLILLDISWPCQTDHNDGHLHLFDSLVPHLKRIERLYIDTYACSPHIFLQLPPTLTYLYIAPVRYASLALLIVGIVYCMPALQVLVLEEVEFDVYEDNYEAVEVCSSSPALTLTNAHTARLRTSRRTTHHVHGLTWVRLAASCSFFTFTIIHLLSPLLLCFALHTLARVFCIHLSLLIFASSRAEKL